MKKMLKMGISFTMGAVALFALLTQGLCVHEFGQGIVTKNDTPIDDGSGTCNFSVDSLEQTLSESKAAFVPGDSLWSLLATRGALAADVPKLAAMWSEAMPQRDERGRNVYPFKGTLVSYYGLDSASLKSHNDFHVTRSSARNYNGHLATNEETTEVKVASSRSKAVLDGTLKIAPERSRIEEAAPSTQHAPMPRGEGNYVVEHIDPTTSHGEISYFRVHKAWPQEADDNSVVRAMQLLLQELLAALSNKRKPTTDVSSTQLNESSAYEAMMTAFRVTQQPGTWGEPGPEGVHQDACELTVVVMMNRVNVAPNTGASRAWTLDQPSGKPELNHRDSETNPNIILEQVLESPFDALFVLDREAKHEAAPFQAADSALEAIRDVFTFEVRRPATPSAASPGLSV